MTSLTFRIQPASATTVRSSLDVIEQRAADFWAHTSQARMLCHVHPVSFAERLDTVQPTQDWRRPYLIEQRSHYAGIEKTVYAVDHYLTLWPDSATDQQVLAATLPDSLQVPHVARVSFPQLVDGQYRVRATYLEPVERGMPYLAVLTAYDLHGGWAMVDVGAYSGWQRLLALSMPLTLAIDVQTLDGFTATNKLTWALERRLSPLQRESAAYLQSVLDTEAVHLVRYAVLLHGRTPDALNRMEQEVTHVTGRRIQFERLPGAQAEHVRFFQDVEPRLVSSPIVARNTSSRGVACKQPFAIRRQVQQHGVLLGTDADEKTPIHHQWFGEDGRQNGNAVIYGSSGYGKTTFMMALALRLAVQGYQIFLMEPAHTCWRLRDAIADRHAVAYHQIADTPVINVLDPQSTRAIDQRDAVVRKLSTTLGKPIHDGGRTRIAAYELNDAEIGALDAALQHERLYGAGGYKLAGMTHQDAPLLSDLVAVLEQASAERPAGAALARRIEDRLLGTAATIYNRPTELHFDPSKDVTLFSFRGVKQERLPLIYAHLFEAINQYVWSPDRDTPSQPVLLFVDEFFFMQSVPLIEEEITKATKTGRGRQFGVVTSDQNVITYSNAMITANARQQFCFQVREEAAILAKRYEGVLQPSHIQMLRMLRRGECLGMLDDEIRSVRVDVLPLEARFLLQ